MRERRFERVRMPETANVVAEEDGRRVGTVRVLGAGGMLVEGVQPFVDGSPHRLTIVDESERIRCDVVGVQLYEREGAIAYEFRALEVDAAIKIGVLLGRYYGQVEDAKR